MSRLKITIECECDKQGNLLGWRYQAKSFRKGPTLRSSFIQTTKAPSIELMRLTFDLDGMKPGTQGEVA